MAPAENISVAHKIYTENDYYALPGDVRAELIDGVIYNMAMPSRIHQAISGELFSLIHAYIRKKGGDCKVYYAPFSVKLNKSRRNIVEPDITVICDPKKLTDDGCEGAPDWIIEILSPSNPSHDFVRKLNLYQDNGVKEYWIVDPMTKEVQVYRPVRKVYRATTYTFMDKVPAGIYDDLEVDFGEISRTLGIPYEEAE